MQFAEDAATILGLEGEDRVAFLKTAEEEFDRLMTVDKTAGKSDPAEAMLKKVLQKMEDQKKGRGRYSDALFLGVVGAPIVGGIINSVFAKRKSKQRFNNMMAEAEERNMPDISQHQDTEKVEAAFHIVNSYSPSIAAHPLLAANATRHILVNALGGQGGLDPTALPALLKAEKGIQEARGKSFQANAATMSDVVGAAERLAGLI